jgi:hypothetical protein
MRVFRYSIWALGILWLGSCSDFHLDGTSGATAQEEGSSNSVNGSIETSSVTISRF